MLSRLARPVTRLAPRAVLAPHSVALLRTFSTKDPAPSSSYPWEKGAWDPMSGYPTPVTPNNGDDHVSIIKQYGWRPFVGGLGGLLLFKEVHAIKEESILACLTLTTFYVAYIMGGDKLLEAADAAEAKRRKTLTDLSNAELAGLDMYMHKLKLPAALPPLLERMSQEHRSTAEKWVAHKNAEMRAALAHETLERLSKLAQSEAAAEKKASGDMKATALKTVMAEFKKADPKMQKELLDWAILVAGTKAPPKDLPVHPVVRTFKKVLQDLKDSSKKK